MSLALLFILNLVNCEDYVHSPIQYHSQTDHGSYNYGYDTGLYGSHQFHQERKEVNGQVYGRYGYTDPYGKLRTVYYKSGPQGFQIIEDTGAVNSKLRAENSLQRNAIQSTPYKQIYSRASFRKPSLPTTPVASARQRRPFLIRKYRNSGPENSRVYLAGRDYARDRHRDPVPIHRVEGPVSTAPIRRSFAPAPSSPRDIPEEVRSVRYSAPPVPSSSSSRIINTHELDHVPRSIVHTPSPVSRSLPAAPPISRSYSQPVPYSAPISGRSLPRSYSVPSTINAPSSSFNSIEHHRVDVDPAPLYAGRPGLPPRPVVVSGRGIPSPSAAARLRASLLRNSSS